MGVSIILLGMHMHIKALKKKNKGHLSVLNVFFINNL